MRPFYKHAVKLLSILLIAAFIAALCVPAHAALPDYDMSSSYKNGEYYQKLLNVKLTGDMRTDIVAVARSQVGYMEGDSSSQLSGTVKGGENYTEYGNFYNYYSRKYYGEHSTNYMYLAWCGMYVSFCAYVAKIPGSVLRITAEAKPKAFRMYGSEANAGSQYKTVYDLKVNGGTYIPAPGDIIFFGKSSSHNPDNVSYKHVGIVESASFSYDEKGRATMTINTFEGNTSDKVTNKHWTLTAGESGTTSGYIYKDTYIAGFGIPNYNSSTVADDSYAYDIGSYAGTVLKKDSKGMEVYKLQQGLSILKAGGVISSSVSRTGTFDDKTKTAVLEFQNKAGLTADAQVGSSTWSSLRSYVNRAVENASSDFISDGDTLLLYRGKSSEVEVPAGCVVIASLAFPSSSLKQLILPVGVKRVEPNAFLYASGLKTVIHKDSQSAVNDMSVSSTGNDYYKAAEHQTETPSFTVTFNTGNLPVETTCELGAVPVYTGPEPQKTGPGAVYIFTGWDKPFTAVTGNTVYTAQFFRLQTAPIVVAQNVDMVTGDEFSMNINLCGLDARLEAEYFSFNVDFREYAGSVSLVGYSTALSGVEVVEQTPGKLTVTKDADGSAVGDESTLITLDFVITDPDLLSAELQINILFGEGQGVYATTGAQTFLLPASAELSKVAVCREKPVDTANDFNNDGEVNINDVTALLNFLASAGPQNPDAINAGLTINDVTALLNLLAA